MGLIPREWNLAQLTSGQKSYVTKQANKHAKLIKRVASHPNEYAVRKVSEKTAKNLKAAGYEVNRGRAIIPTKKGYELHVSRNGVTFESAREKQRILLKSGEDFLKKLANLGKHRLPPNHFYALKVGNSPTMKRVQPNMPNLLQYAGNVEWHNEDGKEYVSLVIVHYKHGVQGQTYIGNVQADGDEDDEDDGDEEFA